MYLRGGNAINANSTGKLKSITGQKGTRIAHNVSLGKQLILETTPTLTNNSTTNETKTLIPTAFQRANQFIGNAKLHPITDGKADLLFELMASAALIAGEYLHLELTIFLKSQN
jgi:hypothetical protein